MDKDLLNKRFVYLCDNGEYDACKGAIECFIINFWREELTDEQNLEKFNVWCVEQFKEFEDEE